MEQAWIVREKGFSKDSIAVNGSKFMTGNGYMGYRGTLEEFGKSELAACTLAGLYDKVGDRWREPVNAPNGLFVRLYANGHPLHVLENEPVEHEQELSFQDGVHRRRTVFAGPDGEQIALTSERFASMADVHLLAMRFTVESAADLTLTVETGIDGDVWDINGPHLEQFAAKTDAGELLLTAVTHELKQPVAVAESFRYLTDPDPITEKSFSQTDKSIYRRLTVSCKAGAPASFAKFAAVYTGLDPVADTGAAALAAVRRAASGGYEAVLAAHQGKWQSKWAEADVQIEGDDEAQFALRYSIYHLLIIAPADNGKVSIPARGLSGQVYKGAIFWDTEMFMFPFFCFSQPEAARNLVLYRCQTLDGARRKAAEYGFQGAYYAWESQDTGDDACTLFNITDVFTNRPMRTYFRDKQIHISADVVHGIWQYIAITGDYSVLAEGGAEVILECARFFLSYSYWKPEKKRLELLDVTGPDEYHERVNNNVFTNYMAKETFEVALELAEWLGRNNPELLQELLARLGGGELLERIREAEATLYLPQPDPVTGVIEQFDSYYRLEDPTLAELRSRVIHKNEYWGGGNGLASTTQIIKQADVVLALHLFKGRFSRQVREANWKFYEPRTEHGSSLSPCVYALVASDIGLTDWAYKYFMRTATIDLTGDSKQYVGDLYIGGTHPAANGGAWMAAVLGFAGLRYEADAVYMDPALPSHWRRLAFSICVHGRRYHIRIEGGNVTVSGGAEGEGAKQRFIIGGEPHLCGSGESITTEGKRQHA